MEKELIIQKRYKGKLTLDYLPALNYAMILNGNVAFRNFTLRNEDEVRWDNVKVVVSGEMIETCTLNVALLPRGESVSFDDANLMPVAGKLMALTEAVQSSFEVCVCVEGETVANQSFPLLLLAFDQWQGLEVMPELLAAFVTPNHPCITPVVAQASKYLEEASGCRDLDEYQSQSDSRVTAQIESVYRALLDQDITYAAVPPSVGCVGQRIRLADHVLATKMGNCIELSLLLCACLENIGIKTMMVLYRGHAMMGAWIDPGIPLFTPCVNEPELIEDFIDENNRALVLIEATALTRGEKLADAVAEGEGFFLKNGDQFKCFVDLFTARQNNIRPLPHCIHSDQGWEIDNSLDYDALFDELRNRNPYDIQGASTVEKLKSKQLLWERKLLDISLRNSLLNMRSGKRFVPLKNLGIDEILAHLKAESLVDDVEDDDNFSTLKELHRAARNSIEENGANTLFLSLGTLRWYETDSTRPYFAPVIFVPIEMVRHGARKYLIRRRDEEALMNITLLEMMRQTFELEIPDLSQVLESDDDAAPDWRRVFGVLRTAIAEVNENRPAGSQWQIVEECMVGIFSFTRFVMWNDIHSNPQVLAHQPLLRSLIEGRLVTGGTAESSDVRQLDRQARPSEYAIPVDVDSSQLEAVVNSGKGKSFILHGPPGTGKSQTITNIIANALYHGKRVLFVSEKKAALDVVQDRLERIGLKPFCLELHSNKVNKKSFLEQVSEAVNVPLQPGPAEFQLRSDELFARRSELNDYIEAMHMERTNGLSLYEYINGYLDVAGESISMPYEEVGRLSLPQMEELCTDCTALDKIREIVGLHPANHPLLGLYPRENTAENQRQVTQTVAMLPQVIAAVCRKADGWFNRLFLKRTPERILTSRREWLDFMAVADVENELKNSVTALLSAAQRWNGEIERLRLWYHYSLRAQKIAAYGVPEVLQYYLQGHSGRETAEAFRKGYYRRMALNVIDNDTALRSFNGMLFDDIIESYRKLTGEFKELTRKELVSRLSQRIPRGEIADKTLREEMTTLRKRISNNGRSTSVRRILQQTRNVLPQLCPCMLMSPLSVAQYLEMRSDLFDLVVFDEASQMPTSEAVGAIARGKSVIVVGDPKQMPPTSFFVAQSTNEDDVDIDDMESILDDCISLALPSHYLSWHYRSKHESLIAFSNTHFYDGRLITFPSVDDLQRKVTLQHVAGTYDIGKSRSNKAEAKAIVDEVLARLSAMVPAEGETEAREPYRSLGIVAFSKVQSNLIEDMLVEALAHKPELEKLAMSGDEPIFVKNLENVQGDERDVILFSVGYGPDKQGRVSMNFGPLNQTGGERRLNVAVSRARYEMKVFSSLESHQIDLQRTSALGVISLKRFLEYAETGHLPRPAMQIEEDEIAPVTQLMADDLRAQGYEVHTNIGHSKFKIDLAIVDKDNPSRYSMGIITDGRSYHQTPTARDREIIQPSVLTALGWNVKHMWTADRFQ